MPEIQSTSPATDLKNAFNNLEKNLKASAAPKTEMWGGLMAYENETETLRTQVRAARDAGCEGAILFAYDPGKMENCSGW